MIKITLITVVSILFIYSFLIEPNLIKVNKITLKSDSIKNTRIVFVSDFHLSKFAKRRLDKIVKKINELKPDIVISGGDYAILHRAKYSMDMDYAAKKLSGIKTKYGFYSVLGNHDYFQDGKYIKESLEKNKIKILENSNYKININGASLYIAGISDMQTTFFDLEKALKNTKRPLILVSHSPDIMPLAKNRADLILAGHTHGGQVRIPFFGAVIVPSKYGKRFEYGFIENLMYVTSGLGTSILKMRFNCMPEITVIDYTK